MIELAKSLMLIGSLIVVGTMYFFFSIKPPTVIQGDVIKNRQQASFLSIDESILPTLTQGETYTRIGGYKETEIGKKELFENPIASNFFAF